MKTTIVNVHIPKTAGTTFRKQMSTALPALPGGAHLLGVDRISRQDKVSENSIHAQAKAVFEDLRDDALQFVSGHYLYREIADLVAPIRDRVILTTFIRDPRERMLSDYFYCISERHPTHEAFKVEHPDFASYMNNPRHVRKQRNFLSPFAKASAQEAATFVRDTFDFVGTTETFDDDFQAFTRRIGLSCPAPVRLNTAAHKDLLSEAREAHAKDLDRIMAEEMEFYKRLQDVSAENKAAPPFTMVGQTPSPDQPKVTATPTVAPEPDLSPEDQALLDQAERLAPWHHNIRLNNTLTTGVGRQQDATGFNIKHINPEENFHRQALPFLPDGMTGKSFLDCACNGGGYSFAAKDAGAARTFGFDVRQHWIDQANFVVQNRERASDNMTFVQAEAMALADLEDRFDVTWFNGLLCHLPDPIGGLKLAAERTDDLLFINTTVQALADGDKEEFTLSMRREKTDNLMAGADGLGWLPAGYQTLRHILGNMGFPETQLIFWRRNIERPKGGSYGRLMLVAAREEGRLTGK